MDRTIVEPSANNFFLRLVELSLYFGGNAIPVLITNESKLENGRALLNPRFAGTTKGTSSERQLNSCIVQPATVGATE